MNLKFERLAIKEINENDSYQISNLFALYRHHMELYNKEFIHNLPEGRLINEEERTIFVALATHQHSASVGFVQLFTKYSPFHKKSTFITDLFVIHEFRNNGIALKLIEVAVKYAIENISTSIEAEVFDRNKIADRIYQSVGFKKQIIKENYSQYYINLERE